MIVKYKNKKGQDRTWVLQQAVISALRRLSYKTPMRQQALAKARIVRGKYKCEKCAAINGPKGIAVDHIDPVLSVTEGFKDWNTFIARLFVPTEKLQILCKECHNAKTKAENKERRISKAKKGSKQQT